MIVLAIDPGPEQSAWIIRNTEPRAKPLPMRFVKDDNLFLRRKLPGWCKDSRRPVLSIEMIASYGMPVGREVFETCVWIGRFVEAWGGLFAFVYRRDVKLHLCGSPRAKDANVRQALLDKWGGKQQAIGTKASPGPLRGVKADCWAALGVAVTYAETVERQDFAKTAPISPATALESPAPVRGRANAKRAQNE